LPLSSALGLNEDDEMTTENCRVTQRLLLRGAPALVNENINFAHNMCPIREMGTFSNAQFTK